MTPKETPLAHDRARYRRGCRCGECREANREYQRRYRYSNPQGTAHLCRFLDPVQDGFEQLDLRHALSEEDYSQEPDVHVRWRMSKRWD